MTKGAPLGHLFLYAVPLLLGNWLQLAYNAVDSIIAGRFIGQDALAAEGVAGPVMNLVILAISGLCIGAGVLMSEAFGAKRTARLKETLATTLLFGAALCCAAAALGCALTPWVLRALAVAGLFGALVKRNGSISGAECGCQAEIGSACSMASAALAELFGMDIGQIEYAAEVAMEHHLGLTCDPIKGLVQMY